MRVMRIKAFTQKERILVENVFETMSLKVGTCIIIIIIIIVLISVSAAMWSHVLNTVQLHVFCPLCWQLGSQFKV